jgi:hypothetical protein
MSQHVMVFNVTYEWDDARRLTSDHNPIVAAGAIEDGIRKIPGVTDVEIVRGWNLGEADEGGGG